MAPRNDQVTYNKLKREIHKIWNRLKDEPERGIVVREIHPEASQNTIKAGKVYTPSITSFTEDLLKEYGKGQEPNPKASEGDNTDYKSPAWSYQAENYNKTWVGFIKYVKEKYGLGPEISDPKITNTDLMKGGLEWWKQKKVHLSKNKKYYVVPLAYEKIQKNKELSNHFTGLEDDKKLNLSSLLEDKAFISGAKGMAIRKLGRDLGIALQLQDGSQHMLDAQNYGTIPIKPTIAEAVHISPRKKEFQSLWIKVLFDRGWVESLPLKVDPSVNLDLVSHEVMIFTRELEFDLNNLQRILNHFHGQFKNSESRIGNISINFDGECTAGKISKVYETLNEFMILNGKPPLKDLEKTDSAIQFGFTEDYRLKYISFSEVPDCLCDKENLSAYILKAGIEETYSTPPFSSSTVNGLLHYLPEIKRKYSKYLTSSGISSALFSSQQSWVSFAQKYVYPPVDISYSSDGTPYDQTGLMDLMKNPAWAKIMAGSYLQDPTQVLSPQMKEIIAASSDAMSLQVGDDALFKALTDDIFSTAGLYEKLLNKIPAVELTKMLVASALKCVPFDDFKKQLCKQILKTVPLAEIRVMLYPCLRQLGSPGELAIARLEEMVSGRKGLVYQMAKSRYPDKFTKDPSEQAASEADLAAITKLYCSDPTMQNKLGRSPDDFNDELEQWASEKAEGAICDCILSIYGPAQDLAALAEDVSGMVIDELFDSRKNRPEQIEKQGTLSFKKFIKPFLDWSKPGDKLAGWGEFLAKALVDMATNILLATLLILLKYVKQEILGSLLTDMCNSSGDGAFGFKSLSSFIMESPLYEDNGQQQIWDKVKGMKKDMFLNPEVQALIDGFDKLSLQHSPSEVKRLLTTECNDNSADSLYATAATVFIPADTIAAIQSAAPGVSVLSSEGEKIAKEQGLPGYMSIDQCHEFLHGVGQLFDTSVLDDSVDQYNDFKEKFIDLCDPDSAAIQVLCEGIACEDVALLAEKDKQDLINDIISTVPLLDPKALEDQFPPLFCGPCNPRQVGQEPLMPKPTDPSQLYMFDQVNSATYTSIDKTFNNNLLPYKNIIAETIKDYGKYGAALPINLPDSADKEDPTDTFKSGLNALIISSAASFGNFENTLVANALRTALKSAIEDPNGFGNQIKDFDINENFAAYLYEVPNSNYDIHLAFNYNDTDGREYILKPTGRKVTINPKQIKIIIIDKTTGNLDYEWPKDEDDTIINKDFNLNDVGAHLLDYYKSNENASKNLATTLSTDAASLAFKGLFPIATSYLFETLLMQATTEGLFKASNFSEIPFTNDEIKAKCIEGLGSTPLLNIEKVIDDVDKTRQSLECVVSTFDTPDSLQIASVYGLYTLLIKVCVVEEYLKNIFMFAFIRIRDILETDAYMEYFLDNIKDLVRAKVGHDGYENLLYYSEKIINGRKQLGMFEDEENPSDFLYLSPQNCLEILVKEIAIEVNDILDDRVRTMVNPSWKSEIIDFEEAGEADAEKHYLRRMMKYFVKNEYWNKPLYPVRKYDTPDADGNYTLHNNIPFFSVPTTDLGSPFAPNWNGGLIRQPYLRLKSVFADDILNEKPEDLDAPNANLTYVIPLKKFWSKFKEAYRYKAIQETSIDTWTHETSEVSSPGPDQGVQTVSTDSGLAFNYWKHRTLVNNDMRFEEPKTVMVGGKEKTYKSNFDMGGPQNSLNTDTLRAMRGAIENIILAVDSEVNEKGDIAFIEDGTIFRQFYDLFFSPLYPMDYADALAKFGTVGVDPGSSPPTAPDNIVGATAKDDAVLGKTAYGQRSFFSRILSSYTGVPPAYASDENKYGSGPSTPGKKETFATVIGNSKNDYNILPFWDGFYYWQHYPYGVVPAAANEFINRGIIDFDTVSYNHNAPVGGKHKAPNFSTSFFSTCKLSTIALYARAKDVMIGVEQEQTVAGSGQYSGLHDIINGNPVSNVFLKKIGDFLRQDKIGLDKKFIWSSPYTGDDPAMASSYTESESNYHYECVFWKYLLDIVVDAPFDQWFDMSIGMRMNLVIPIESDDQQQISQYFDTIVNLLPIAAGDWEGFKTDKKYLEDKSFVITQPSTETITSEDGQAKWQKSNKDRYFLCIPLEYVEHNLTDYWMDINKDKNNPWHIIYNNTLGNWKNMCLAVDGTSPSPSGIRLAYDWQDDSDANNIQHNIPEIINFFNEAMKNKNIITLSPDPAPGTLDSKLHWFPEPVEEYMNYLRFNGRSESIPTFWATCKLLNVALSEDRRWTILDNLNSSLMNKISGTGSGADKPHKLFEEVFPIQEGSITAALFYRYFMEGTYPQLSTLLKPTKDLIANLIAHAEAAHKGDYQYLDEVSKNLEMDAADEMTSPSTNEIVGMFFKLVIQMGANMVDPTWKTPWFFPGPLTPVGVLAKYISRSEKDKNKDKGATDKLSTDPNKDPCED
tara:strand:+ start:1138 stop:8355 length:7218 start_codon:yes stop_codon:yes gene_type:complete